MHSDNAHISLRRRMSSQLGRSISNPAWALAQKEGRVAEAVEPVYGHDAEEELLAYLKDLLRVEDAGLRKRLRSDRASSRGLPNGRISLARVEAVSRLAADHAAGDEEILQFRRRVLGRDAPMTADEAEAYLDQPEARQSSVRPPHGNMEILRYQNRHISHDLHVWPRSPLDDLRVLAEKLSRSYPWEPAQAAAFVLEGLIPLATPFMLRLPQAWHDGRPKRSRLTMEVDLWMPAAEVVKAYRDVQRRVLPGHNRPVSAKSIDLVNFVTRNRPAPWPRLLERWNTEHPGLKYSNYRSFRSAYVRASQSLLHPGYRLWLGQEN